MIPSQLLEVLRYAGPIAPFLVALYIFRRHIRFTFHFDGRDSSPKVEPKKRNTSRT